MKATGLVSVTLCTLDLAVFALVGVPSVASAQSARKNAQQKSARQPGRDPSALFKRFDKDGDGLLEGDEIPRPLRRRLQQIDQNKDGKISLEEIKKARPSRSGRPGEIVTGPARGERHADTLKEGEPAPDFTLSDPLEQRMVTLSSFQGKRPVVLIFGSYT